MLASKANLQELAESETSVIRVYNTLTNRKEVFQTVQPESTSSASEAARPTVASRRITRRS